MIKDFKINFNKIDDNDEALNNIYNLLLYLFEQCEYVNIKDDDIDYVIGQCQGHIIEAINKIKKLKNI